MSLLLFTALLSAATCAHAAQNLIASSPPLDAILAKQFGAYSTSESIDERARRAAAKATAKPHVLIVQDGEEDVVLRAPAGSVPSGISAEVLVGVANADLIIKGIPLERRSLPTADRSFLYSQYAVRVTQVLSPNASVSPGSIILVARPGGTLYVDGVFVRSIDPDLQLFKLDRPYYFILRQVPGTNAFRAFGSGTFEVVNGHVVAPSDKAKSQQAKSEKFFVSEVERAVAHRPWTRKEQR